MAVKRSTKPSTNPSAKTNVLQRESIGRKSSQGKIVGDALTTAATAAATGLWSATRTGSGAIFWPIGLIGLGAIGMVEAQPGTFLESGSAGILGANATVGILRVLGLIK